MVQDRLPSGALVPGGPALYCARAALALGAAVDVVTHLPPGYPGGPLQGLHVLDLPASSHPVFENVYDDGARHQRMTGSSMPLDEALDLRFDGADILILAPVFGELTRWPRREPGLASISLQGVLRTVDGAGNVCPRPDALEAALEFARPGAVATFSDEDCAEPARLAAALAQAGMVVTLTHGHRGATLFRGSDRRHYEPLPSGPVVDPTGAGDCFGTAFTVRYFETGDLEQAMAYGLAAGSIAIEREGLRAAASRDELQKRIAGRAA